MSRKTLMIPTITATAVFTVVLTTVHANPTMSVITFHAVEKMVPSKLRAVLMSGQRMAIAVRTTALMTPHAAATTLLITVHVTEKTVTRICTCSFSVVLKTDHQADAILLMTLNTWPTNAAASPKASKRCGKVEFSHEPTAVIVFMTPSH